MENLRVDPELTQSRLSLPDTVLDLPKGDAGHAKIKQKDNVGRVIC